MESLYSLGEYMLHIGVNGEDKRVGEAISKEVAAGNENGLDLCISEKCSIFVLFLKGL